MVTGTKRDTPEVGCQYLNIIRDACYDTCSDTTNVKYTLSCTRPSKIITNGVGVPPWGSRLPHVAEVTIFLVDDDDCFYYFQK